MNSNFTKSKIFLGFAGIFFLTAAVLVGTLLTGSRQNFKNYAANSAILSIAPQNQSVHAGDDVTFNVNLETGTSNVTGVDLILNFDPNAIKIDSLDVGSGITNLDNIITNSFDNSNGKVIFTAFTLNKNLAINGSSLNVLTINAKTVQTASVGNYSLSFDSTTAVSATSETHSVLTDSIPGTLTVVVSPTPSPAQGEPNSCNGTCGSNINCQSNYTCYQGYCRNPNCTSDASCECKVATPVPTKKPTATNKTNTVSLVATPTSEPVIMIPSVPEPTTSSFWQTVFNTESPDPLVNPTLAPIDLPQAKNDSFWPWVIGSLIVVGIILVVISVIIAKNDGRHKPKPPVINI